MEIKIADNSQVWDNFLIQNQAIFTQSWEWGRVWEAEGKNIERLVIYQNNEIIAVALTLFHHLPFGFKYVFCPAGPVVRADADLFDCLTALTQYWRQHQCIFARIEPLILPNNRSNQILRRVLDVNPSHTFLLSLNDSLDTIWQNFDKKTRYEIRQAQKNNLIIKEEKNLDIFWHLLNATATHDGFRTHSRMHYQKILDSTESIQLNAYYHDQPIATAIFWQWGGMFTYLFAATDRNFNTLSAAYLIQWEAIRLAVSRGCVSYDFFGVAPKTSTVGAVYNYDRKHRYAGFTKFKIGFGGEHKNFPGTFDLVLNSGKYYFYLLLRLVRRLV